MPGGAGTPAASGASGAVGVEDADFSGEVYATATAHHRAHDADVLAPVTWAPGLRVLDVGCGVGDLTVRVADLVAPGEVLGVDSSASQVAHAAARAARPGLRFEVARVQQLEEVVPAGWADVVLSVATLHWVVEAEQPLALAQVARTLRPGGVFRLDMGGAGQIAAARAVLDEVAAEHGVGGSPWFFPDEAAATSLLEGAGLRPRSVRLLRQRRQVPDAAALEAWLRSQVLPGYARGRTGDRAFQAEAVRRCAARLRRDDGSFDQDYVRLDAVAHRPA